MIEAKITFQVTGNEDVTTKVITGRNDIIQECAKVVNDNYFYCRVENEGRVIFEYTDNRVIECDMNIKPFINKLENKGDDEKMENKITLKGSDTVVSIIGLEDTTCILST